MNESLFENECLVGRCGHFAAELENVIRHTGITACDTIEDVIEWNYGVFLVAVLAGFNQFLGFTHSRFFDEHNDLFLRCRVKEIEEFERHDSGDLARNHRILID